MGNGALQAKDATPAQAAEEGSEAESNYDDDTEAFEQVGFRV